MKNTFVELLKDKFQTKTLDENETTATPENEDIGDGVSRELSNETIKSIEDLLNSLVIEGKSIDAIFLYDLENKCVRCKNTIRSKKVESPSEIKSFEALIKALNDIVLVSQCGKLEYSIFILDDGVINLYFIDDFKCPIVLGFVSAMSHGLGELLFYSNNYVDTIKAKLSIHNFGEEDAKVSSDRILSDPSEVIKQIKNALAIHIGPIANIVCDEYIENVGDIKTLNDAFAMIEAITPEIEDQAKEQEFKEKLQKDLK